MTSLTFFFSFQISEQKENSLNISWDKKNICDCSRSKQMPWTDQITKIFPDVRTFSELPSNMSIMQKSSFSCPSLHKYTIFAMCKNRFAACCLTNFTFRGAKEKEIRNSNLVFGSGGFLLKIRSKKLYAALYQGRALFTNSIDFKST